MKNNLKICCIVCIIIFSVIVFFCGIKNMFKIGNIKDDGLKDENLILVFNGEEYINVIIPVKELPKGYEYAGKLSKKQANNTELAKHKYYVSSYDPDSVYVYQKTGTLYNENTVGTGNSEWNYMRWIRTDAKDFHSITRDLVEICTSEDIENDPYLYVKLYPEQYKRMVETLDKYTLEYCFGQFLKGNQEDIRGTIMSLICSDIVNKWENFSMDDADMLGQEWFISFKNHAENLAEQFGDEEMKEKYPASWLLLNL